MRPLNSPLELGVRALILLTAAYPRSLDVDRLVLMDYCLLHSADLGGPSSVFPPMPVREGELGIKRAAIEHGVHLMVRAEMVDVLTTASGFTYRAGEKASPFLMLLDSTLVAAFGEVARWVVAEFGDLSNDGMREKVRQVAGSWTGQPADGQEAAGLSESEHGDESDAL